MNIAKWKIWGGMLGLIVAALGFFKVRGDHYKGKAEKATQKAATAEKRYEHKEAVTEAEREAVSDGKRLIDEAVSKAKSGDRSHFE